MLGVLKGREERRGGCGYFAAGETADGDDHGGVGWVLVCELRAMCWSARWCVIGDELLV